jgi:hypothetical protein
MISIKQCRSGGGVKFKKSAPKNELFPSKNFLPTSCKKISDKKIKDYPICILALFLYPFTIFLPFVIWLEKSVK